MSTQPWNTERKPGNRRNIGWIEQSRKRNQQQPYRDRAGSRRRPLRDPAEHSRKHGQDGDREQRSDENEGQEQQIISLPWRMLGTVRIDAKDQLFYVLKIAIGVAMQIAPQNRSVSFQPRQPGSSPGLDPGTESRKP